MPVRPKIVSVISEPPSSSPIGKRDDGDDRQRRRLEQVLGEEPHLPEAAAARDGGVFLLATHGRGWRSVPRRSARRPGSRARSPRRTSPRSCLASITRKRPSWKPKMWISTRPITKLGTDRNSDGKPRSKPWPNRLGRNWVPKAITPPAAARPQSPRTPGSASRAGPRRSAAITGRFDRIDRPKIAGHEAGQRRPELDQDRLVQALGGDDLVDLRPR